MVENNYENNHFWSKRFALDLIIAVVIVVLPILLYTHLLFDNRDDTTITLGNYSYDHGFGSLQGFIWFVLSMLIPLLLFIIWFFKCPYQWKYFILSPIGLFFYLLIWDLFPINVIAYSVKLLYEIPVVILFLISLVFLDIYLSKINSNEFYLDINSRNNFQLKYKHLYIQINDYLEKLKLNEEHYAKRYYLKKLYSVKQTIQIEITNSSIVHQKNKIFRYSFEIISCLILLIIPLLFYTHSYIPRDAITYNFGWLKLNDFGFIRVSTFLLYLNLKICVVIPLMIWYISCQDWWRNALLVPIILYTYQIWETLQNAESTVSDKFELVKALPAIIFILCLLLYLSYLIKYKYKIIDVYELLNREIDNLVDILSNSKGGLNDKKEKLSIAKEGISSKESTAQHLASLLELKEALISQLNTRKKN